MNSKKCLTCGLVNFDTVQVCRRCGSAISALTYSTSPIVAPAGAASLYAMPVVAAPAGAESLYGFQKDGSGVQFPNAEEDEERRALANKYLRKMIYGLLWAGGGIAVTVISFTAAATSEAGSSYIVAWGAVLFGIIDFLVGLGGWLKHKS